MKTPRALLLDLDGTLADTLPGLARAVNQTRARLGWPAMPEPAVKVHLGGGAHQLLVDCTGLDATTVEMLLPPWRAFYLEHCTEGTTLLPGARDLLDAARERRIPLAVVTNKPVAPSERILEALGVRDRFAALVGGDSLPVRKPDPAMLHEALRLLGGVAPADAWLVGDGHQDVAAAAAAGCASVLVPGYGDLGRCRALGPSLEVRDLAALVPLLG